MNLSTLMKSNTIQSNQMIPWSSQNQYSSITDHHFWITHQWWNGGDWKVTADWPDHWFFQLIGIVSMMIDIFMIFGQIFHWNGLFYFVDAKFMQIWPWRNSNGWNNSKHFLLTPKTMKCNDFQLCNYFDPFFFSISIEPIIFVRLSLILMIHNI